MSEPTDSGKRQHDPDRDPKTHEESEKNEDAAQGSAPDSTFNDPTAPVWANPTAPIPSPPTPPGAAQPATPPVAPPMTNPYAQPSPAPYGQPTPAPYGQQPFPAPYGQQQSGQQFPVYGQPPQGTTQHSPASASAIVLTVLSGVSLIFCNVLAIASLILGIIAITKNTTDHEGSRRYTKIGWIVFAAAWIVGIILVVLLVVLSARASNNPSSDMFGN
jgi:hypothetical protein